MDVVASKFEIGRNSAGSAKLATWIAAQVSGSVANKLLALPTFRQNDLDYALAIMSTTLSPATSNTVVGPNVAVKAFSILSTDFTPLATWMSGKVAGVAAPAAATLSLIAAGALTGQGTLSVRLSYATPNGETLASTAATLAVTDNHELVVASPAADPTGLATGYYVYIGTSGNEKKQSNTPTALGTAYTVTATPSTSGTVVPTTNGTSLTVLQKLEVYARAHDIYALVVLSN